MAHYYESADLGRFAEVGTHNKELMDKFFEYYGAATGTDGALTKREKQLIGLAVAHTIQCPYCIEIHTKKARAAGCSEAELAETVMVAAALRAGGSITHGTHCLE